jgi:hypothetical protein
VDIYVFKISDLLSYRIKEKISKFLNKIIDISDLDKMTSYIEDDNIYFITWINLDKLLYFKNFLEEYEYLIDVYKIDIEDILDKVSNSFIKFYISENLDLDNILDKIFNGFILSKSENLFLENYI